MDENLRNSFLREFTNPPRRLRDAGVKPTNPPRQLQDARVKSTNPSRQLQDAGVKPANPSRRRREGCGISRNLPNDCFHVSAHTRLFNYSIIQLFSYSVI